MQYQDMGRVKQYPYRPLYGDALKIRGAGRLNYIITSNKGFSLIELILALIIMGVLIITGGQGLYLLWREHYITAQKYYLQQEAQYAMDYLINGKMDININRRLGGIISSHNVIRTDTDEYELRDRQNNLQGKISLAKERQSLFLQNEQNLSEQILPTKGSEVSLAEPYTIDLNIDQDPNIVELFNIMITLEGHIHGVFLNQNARVLSITMQSQVNLRN